MNDLIMKQPAGIPSRTNQHGLWRPPCAQGASTHPTSKDVGCVSGPVRVSSGGGQVIRVGRWRRWWWWERGVELRRGWLLEAIDSERPKIDIRLRTAGECRDQAPGRGSLRKPQVAMTEGVKHIGMVR